MARDQHSRTYELLPAIVSWVPRQEIDANDSIEFDMRRPVHHIEGCLELERDIIASI